MIERLDLPDDGGAAGPCESVSRGLVFHVDKCLDHEHWIHLHSQNLWEAEADGLHHVIAHDGSLVESDTWIRLTAATDVDIEAEDINVEAASFLRLHAGDIIDITAEAFARSLSPNFVFGLDAPYQDERAGLLQLVENGMSGIYLGNTDNPARKVLDWYEEGEWTPAWSAGSVALPSAAVAKYTRIGNIVVAHLRLVIDLAAVPAGLDAWAFTVPFAPSGPLPCGPSILVRGGVHRAATATIDDATTVKLLLDGAYVTSASPPGLAAGDTVAITMIYETE